METIVTARPNNKKKGRKSEVYPFEIKDMQKMINYFIDNEMWIHYLAFTLSCNMARRVGDMLSLRWNNFFDPRTGNFRQDILEIKEQKTDKLANPKINQACRNAIQLYIEKTGCDVTKDNYSVPVFMQLSGTHKGTILSDSGYLKAIKRVAGKVGIEYNVGTHSPRKTFGMMSRMLHPSDYNSMELLQTIYNHRDTKTTNHYIGLTKKEVDKYYDDMGSFFEEYVVGGKEYAIQGDKPMVTLDSNDLRDVIRTAYEMGRNSADAKDAMIHVDNINTIMELIESFKK